MARHKHKNKQQTLPLIEFLFVRISFFMILVVIGLLFSLPAGAFTIQDIPSTIKVGSGQDEDFDREFALFGTDEKQSKSLKAFTKWAGVFNRFDRTFSTYKHDTAFKEFVEEVHALKDESFEDQIWHINNLVNSIDYINDNKNWGKSDYWATPFEFIKNGGDCEDFAITKYVAFKMLGVSEDRLRLAIVHDKVKNIPHAILIVYTDEGPVFLDNQIKRVQKAKVQTRYKPIYSINHTSWWLHTTPKATVVASVR